MTNRPFKLSATSLSCFLESPKAFFFRYIKRLEPIGQSVQDFSHDKICGILWSGFVDRFYKRCDEQKNLKFLLDAWHEQTEGWVPEKIALKYAAAMQAWATAYYQQFSPDDGVRNGSEKRVENERFVGYLDGLSHDGKILHECKSTSRGKQISEQILKFQMSLQTKLYAVLARAEGILYEFAYKDEPYAVFRAPVYPFTPEEVAGWEKGFNALADYIYSLGTDSDNYICCGDQCAIVTKNFVSVCPYQPLCLGMEGAEIGFKPKEHRK